jgi:hypothetical protein
MAMARPPICHLSGAYIGELRPSDHRADVCFAEIADIDVWNKQTADALFATSALQSSPSAQIHGKHRARSSLRPSTLQSSAKNAYASTPDFSHLCR